MTFSFDDSLMYRPALDQLHGLDAAVRQTLTQRFVAVQQEQRRLYQAGEYQFLTLGRQDTVVTSIEQWATAQRGKYQHLLVLGIGGSALGARALLAALKTPAWNELSADKRDGLPTLTVLDNVDPVTVTAALERLDPRKTIVDVISKSGGTAETLAQYLIVRHWLNQALGEKVARQHLVITTDPVKGPLRALASTEGIQSFEVPPAVGGRFSVLTPVGLVPAALLGIDLRALLSGAQEAIASAESDDLSRNPAALWAGLQWQAQATRATNIHVLMPYSDRLREFAEWYRQLWAESLGKKVDRAGREVHRGPTPVGATGATDQHSQIQLFMEGPFDKTITFIRVKDTVSMLPIPDVPGLPPELDYLAGRNLGELLDAEFLATRKALATQGRMSSTIEIETVNANTFGHLIMFFQIATGYAGLWYDVNPFDQPGVELGKVLTREAMKGEKGDGR